MKNNNSSGSFWRVVLIVIAAIFVINALSGGILNSITSVFSSDDGTYMYVHDEACVLSSNDIKYITNKNASLNYQSGARVVVSTVNSLNGADVADKAYELFGEYMPEKGDKNKGVLLLFAVNDGKYYALQGRGIEENLSAGTLQLILNANAAPAFAKADYESGIVDTFDAVVSHFEKLYSITVSDGYPPSHYPNGDSLFDKLGELIGGITGIAAKLIKAAVIGFFALFGVIAAIVVTALTVKDKKRRDDTDAPPPPAQQKENKNPYSHK